MSRLILLGLFLITVIHVYETVDVSTTTTIDSESEEVFTEIRRAYEQFKNQKEKLKKDKEKLKIDRQNFQTEKEPDRSIHKTDVIQLNIGGEILATTRETLTLLPNSLFSTLFNGRWERRLHGDDSGNIYFDFNPIVFRHLLDQLQLSQVKNLLPPSNPLLIKPFERMLNKLGLRHLLSISHKNIFTVNVDGQIITTVNQSKFFDKPDVFIDHHPRIFRRFVQSKREQKKIEIECENKWFSCYKNLSMITTDENTLRTYEKINQLHNDIRTLEHRLNKTSEQVFDRPQLKANIVWKNSSGWSFTNENDMSDERLQLRSPRGICVDNDRLAIYIADQNNHRIIQWKLGAENGQIMAGNNYRGSYPNQLDEPTDVILDRRSNSLIICDSENKLVVRWSIENQHVGQIIISNINCSGLAMNENGDLFVSDYANHEVKRWRKGEKEKDGVIVAGGNGDGDQLNQLNNPTFLFIDREDTVYVSDSYNHRVMKWMKDAKEGIIVAGGHYQGNSFKQLSYPMGLIVNEVGDVYVADYGNDRIMCWPTGMNEGDVIVGGYDEDKESNYLNGPAGLSFDRENNLYVADSSNNRILRFNVNS